MTFTMAGHIIAWLAVVLGAAQVSIAIFVAISLDPEATAHSYLGTAYSGVAISEGLLLILCGIALGILTEISRSMKARE